MSNPTEQEYKEACDKSITECKELWRNISACGISKHDYFASHPELHNKWIGDCPLCDFTERFAPSIDCDACPLVKQNNGNGCYNLGFDTDRLPNKEWTDAIMRLKTSEEQFRDKLAKDAAEDSCYFSDERRNTEGETL